MRPPPRDCPCHSGLRYKACCAPFHDGAHEAPTPEALMRSRYAAFALGLGEYLVRTLASTHPDLEKPRDELTRALGRARVQQRFTGLRILSATTSPDGDRGEVLFYARIFERGADRSFAERSTFVREAGAWRYEAGEFVPRAELPEDVDRPRRT
ncbi:MAG TPA: YchJ family metal-binding protein [Polyangia bacterium]|nr:YchJ family metal-binding protein [Polyangia bacterium]